MAATVTGKNVIPTGLIRSRHLTSTMIYEPLTMNFLTSHCKNTQYIVLPIDTELIKLYLCTKITDPPFDEVEY